MLVDLEGDVAALGLTGVGAALVSAELWGDLGPKRPGQLHRERAGRSKRIHRALAAGPRPLAELDVDVLALPVADDLDGHRVARIEVGDQPR